MKTAFKWFDSFLSLLVVGPLIIVASFVGLFIFITNSNADSSQNYDGIIGAAFEFILLISFLFALLYVLIGISLLIINWKVKNKEKFNLGKSFLIKGIVRCILTFVLFFLLSLALSFFGTSTNTLTLPRVPALDEANPAEISVTPDSSRTGFPVKDLKIVNRKQDISNVTNCDITILNTNPTLSTAYISIGVDNRETMGALNTIAPGKTGEMSANSIAHRNDPCNADILILDAGIAK